MTWTNVNLSLVSLSRLCGIQLRVFSGSALASLLFCMSLKIAFLKLQPHFLGANESVTGNPANTQRNANVANF